VNLQKGGANFKNLKVWTEVLQDSFLDLFDSGNLDFATATSIRFSPGGFQRFYDGVSWPLLSAVYTKVYMIADNVHLTSEVGELPLQASPALAAGVQLTRNHPSFGRHRHEHAR
jgi:hypothetical protein